MKRKTNLFYTEGPDSKFLTFSNYTESLTGNFLSTDTKLYPSVFLCLEVNFDNNINDTKTKFINNYLTGYYENKLATLRDYFIENDKKPEDYMSSLGYLLDTIKKFDPKFKITYVGDITEQDYNGTYTDTICTISFADVHIGEIEETNNQNDDNDIIIEKEYEKSLYGWKSNELNLSINPIFDKKKNDEVDSSKINYYYNVKSNTKKLKISKNNISEINFNIVIPLFDVTNINYHTQHYINENINITSNEQIEIDLKNVTNNDLYRKYVPLGIWFADEMITLKKDSNNIFSQSWSLLISSQFKPFPYSNASVNTINENSVSNAYPTFAMILSRQNDILNKFAEISKQLNNQQEMINKIQIELNNTPSVSLDKLNTKIINIEKTVNDKIDNLQNTMKEFMNNFIWNAAQ